MENTCSTDVEPQCMKNTFFIAIFPNYKETEKETTDFCKTVIRLFHKYLLVDDAIGIEEYK